MKIKQLKLSSLKKREKKVKLREWVSGICALQEFLREVLHREGK